MTRLKKLSAAADILYSESLPNSQMGLYGAFCQYWRQKEAKQIAECFNTQLG